MYTCTRRQEVNVPSARGWLVYFPEVTVSSDKVKKKRHLNTSHEDITKRKVTNSNCGVHSKGDVRLHDSADNHLSIRKKFKVCVCTFPQWYVAYLSLADAVVLVSILPFFLPVTTYYIEVNKPLCSLTESSSRPFFSAVVSQMDRKISLVPHLYIKPLMRQL